MTRGLLTGTIVSPKAGPLAGAEGVICRRDPGPIYWVDFGAAEHQPFEDDELRVVRAGREQRLRTWLAMCAGKEKFKSRSDALRVLRHRGLKVYLCRNCICFHVGGGSVNPPKNERRKIKKERVR